MSRLFEFLQLEAGPAIIRPPKKAPYSCLGPEKRKNTRISIRVEKGNLWEEGGFAAVYMGGPFFFLFIVVQAASVRPHEPLLLYVRFFVCLFGHGPPPLPRQERQTSIGSPLSQHALHRFLFLGRLSVASAVSASSDGAPGGAGGDSGVGGGAGIVPGVMGGGAAGGVGAADGGGERGGGGPATAVAAAAAVVIDVIVYGVAVAVALDVVPKNDVDVDAAVAVVVVDAVVVVLAAAAVAVAVVAVAG